MNKFIFSFVALISGVCGFAPVRGFCDGGVKEANVAGMFYPADREELAAFVRASLEHARPDKVEGRIFCLIVPHAGYEFSGAIAAQAYKSIAGARYKTVVILAPSHQSAFPGFSVFPRGTFRTPLGDCEIDEQLAAALTVSPGASFHPEAFAKEHAVEVQLPFLQIALKDFRIVPVVVGSCGLEDCRNLAAVLARTLKGRDDILVVVSSDMYHGYDPDEADKVDGRTLALLRDMDPEGLYAGLTGGSASMCGGLPAVVGLLAAKELGHDKCFLLGHTDSGTVTGRRRKGVWTVGYAALAIDQPVKPDKESAMLNDAQKKRLLQIARSTIETYVKTGKKPALSEADPLLLKELGAFVTLHEHGELRGCIGSMVGTQPLYLTIRDMAIESATDDPRFSPVRKDELKDIEVEISVLSPLVKTDSADMIVMGTHGVLVRRGFHSGVYLPQVATETGWGREEFLTSLCQQKAGLEPDAWKRKDTELYTFTADVFSERQLGR